jgi:ClpP class serine protease
MAHSLVRIKGSLVNTPHLIEQNSFNSIMEYVNTRIEGNAEIIAPTPSANVDYSHRFIKDSATGVMHIRGPLTYRTSGWEAMCGGTSYEMLKEQMQYFVAAGAKTVTMMVDSGGGEAHGMIDSANYLRKVADENGIKLIAYVDGMSASAAYGISCIADEIIMSSDSQVGSIGVLIQLYNDSKALEKAGYERTFITAGKDKVPYAKDGSFTEAFIDRLQASVDALYEGFTGHVATHRSLDIQAVKDTEANVFMAQEALALGLADKVMTVEEFYMYADSTAKEQAEGTMNPFKFTNKEDKAEMAKLEELQATLEGKEAALATALESIGTLEASAVAVGDQLKEANDAIAALTAQLEGFQVEREAAAAAALAAKLESRKAALAEVMPVGQVEAKLDSYANLDDAMFAFMVGELQASKDARAESFKAVGSEGAEEEEAPKSTLEQIRAAGVERAKALRG